MTDTLTPVPHATTAAGPEATAILAEDEPLLAEHLRQELARAWPALRIVRVCGDGASAVAAALELRPDLLFLDIRMPGLSGLEAAEAVAEDWPGPDGSLPLVVFVTAYEQHAVEAFDHAAIDYLLKPLEATRLRRCCERAQASLAQRRSNGRQSEAQDMLDRLRVLLGTTSARPDGPPPSATAGAGAAASALRLIPVGGTGGAVSFVPVDEVLVFEAADKYVRVLATSGEHLIRMSLRQLLPQLDPARFWQVHRGTVVRADAVAKAWRDESGKVSLELNGCRERVAVSRVYAHRFRPW
jgi:DNA-binding LytR/AlgR family response regulator